MATSDFTEDLERAQHLEQFEEAVALLSKELSKLKGAVEAHNELADTFDLCSQKTAKFEEVERVRYIRMLIHDLNDAF